jgi:hypothetical protein
VWCGCDQVVEIIQASTAVDMNDEDGEVELDIDTLDTHTLRQLQTYVAQCLNPVKYRNRTSAGGTPGGPVSHIIIIIVILMLVLVASIRGSY